MPLTSLSKFGFTWYRRALLFIRSLILVPHKCRDIILSEQRNVRIHQNLAHPTPAPACKALPALRQFLMNETTVKEAASTTKQTQVCLGNPVVVAWQHEFQGVWVAFETLDTTAYRWMVGVGRETPTSSRPSRPGFWACGRIQAWNLHKSESVNMPK